MSDVHTDTYQNKNEGDETATYILRSYQFLSVSQTKLLLESLLAVIQILGLDQMNALSLGILTDDIAGLADSLSSSLVNIKDSIVWLRVRVMVWLTLSFEL